MMHQTYAVLGLGRYGMAVATELLKNGAEVLAVDVDEAAVNAAATELPLCKCADVTDREVIRRLGIASMDVVIVAMAKHLEASVLATMLCKEAGVRTVIAKCSNEMHCKILSRVGADRVVFPENESGVRLAKNLLSAGFLDIIDLSGEVSMIELGVRPEWEGRSLSQLDLRRKYSINVVAIKREGEVYIDIDPSEPLEKEMSLIVIANRTKLAKLK
jgi:trk system potassium uptake protein TrkA